ncbi:MAG TPA: hypothetical protein VEU33_34895, partial [Archangium sp.]|nr:hypothetical protein [Archangium sp.]
MAGSCMECRYLMPTLQLARCSAEGLALRVRRGVLLGDEPLLLGQRAQVRLDALPQAGEEEASVALEAAASKEPMKERPSGVDQAEVLRRTFDFDVFACVRCGGRRRLLAYVKQAGAVRAILEHLGLPTAGASLT